MASSRSKKIDVLLVGNENYVQLIERTGGEDVNVKAVKTVDDVLVEHLLHLTSYDLVILAVSVENALKVTKTLRDEYYVKSMILGVASEEDERIELTNSGVSDCVVMPLTDEKMDSVFTKLEAGMKNGSFKKAYFKALIIDDDSDDTFRSHHEKLIRKAGGLVSLSVFALTPTHFESTYDFILMTKASKIKELRDKGNNSVIVGVTSDLEQFKAFLAAGVNQVFAQNLTMEKLSLLI